MTPEVHVDLSAKIDKVEVAMQQSRYLSEENRRTYDKDFRALRRQLEEGALSTAQVEKALGDLDRSIAREDILALMSKIKILNPNSPRLQTLQKIALQLRNKDISPEQSRTNVHDLMESRRAPESGNRL